MVAPESVGSDPGIVDATLGRENGRLEVWLLHYIGVTVPIPSAE